MSMTEPFKPKQMYHRTLPPAFAKTKEREAELTAEGYVTHYIPGAYPMRIFHPTDPNIEGVTITSVQAAKPAEMKKYEGWVDTPRIAREYALNPTPPDPPDPQFDAQFAELLAEDSARLRE